MNSEKSTQLLSPADHFSVLLSPTPRGARLARLLATDWMRDRDLPHRVSEAAEHLVAELAANAATHGRLPGRDFRLRLALDTASDLVRVEVTDAASEKRLPPAPPTSCPEGESGRGLLLVDALSLRWGSTPRHPVGKTVWAEVPVGAT